MKEVVRTMAVQEAVVRTMAVQEDVAMDWIYRDRTPSARSSMRMTSRVWSARLGPT